MATIDEIRKARLAKLKVLKKAGILAYPGELKRTNTAKEAVDRFLQLSRAKKEIIVTGRIRAIRGHGGSTFISLEDGTGTIQAYIKKDGIGEQPYKIFIDAFDVGDFAQVRGTLFKTKAGEKTIQVADFKMLTKSLLPLPDKWHGLQDVEERYRKRYLDLVFNEEAKNVFVTRAKIIKSIREFLESEEFIEVETPVLQPLYGGADAEPFKTHLNAFDMEMYLRIAPELYLKRLLVGGFEKVYEIGRVFRNEGVDRSHNPDFTMLEFYWAYADYKDTMKLTERMFTHMLTQVFGTTKIKYEDRTIDFKAPWPRVEYAELFRKYAKIDVIAMNKEALAKEAKKLGATTDKSFSKARIADAIYKKVIRDKLQDPVFIIHYPSGTKPLAKLLDHDSSKHGNFQLVAAGWELINAYTELNDPVEQKRIFAEQEELFKKGLGDAQRMDTDYIEALEYGMPPATGFGLGIDRLTTLLTNSHSLRETILFPTMKQK